MNVSVIIPHQVRRREFFSKHCLPSVLENDPAEVIIEAFEGGACAKRNAGAAKASQPYLLFVDDDAVLKTGCIAKMRAALEADPGAAFAYSDTEMVVYPGVSYPNPPGVRRGRPWDLAALRRENYIETTSLVRRDVFTGFDPELLRFQDWDLWLSMARAGHRGVYVPEVLFELHHFDAGISSTVPFAPALAAILRKHLT